VQNSSGRPKDLEKRAKILQAAKSLFLKMGYHAANMNQIAKEAGVTKLTVYNHFQDKANLFICAIEETCEESICAKETFSRQKSIYTSTLSDVPSCFNYYLSS
jgi:TetR/AcrR family transcriptional repressor of mexJK operon